MLNLIHVDIWRPYLFLLTGFHLTRFRYLGSME